MALQPFSLVIHRPDPHHQVVSASGPLTAGHGADRSSWSPVFSAAERATAGHTVELDLAAVSQIDAAGLGLLAELCGAMHRRGGMVRLNAVSERVGTLLRITGVGLLFDRPVPSVRVMPFRCRSLKPSTTYGCAGANARALGQACAVAAL